MNPSHKSVQITSDDNYSLHCKYWHAPGSDSIIVILHGVVSHSEWLNDFCYGLTSRGISCLSADRRGAYWVNYLAERTNPCRSISLMAPSLFPSKVITDQDLHISDSSIANQTPLIPLESFTAGPALSGFIKPDPLRLRLVSPRYNGAMAEFSQGVWMKFLRLNIPVLVVLASDDDVVDNDATERVANRYSKADLKLVTLTGKHGIQFDACDELVDEQINWINCYS